jgi:kumamolisin
MKPYLTALAALALASLPLGARAQSLTSTGRFGPGFQSALQPLGRPIAVSGSVLPGLRQAQRTGALAANRRLPLALHFRVRDQMGLDALLQAEYTPGSTLFHHWITPRQFAARFAPTTAQQQHIQDWLRGQGLRVTGTARNGLEMTATGTAGQIVRAFRTSLQTYRLGTQRFFANSAAVQLPAGLAGQIQAVSGLDNLHSVGPASLRLAPRSWATAGSGAAPLTPKELIAGYTMQPLIDAGMHGEGQTLALFQLGDYADENIAAFDSKFGLPAPNIERIPVAGGSDLNEMQDEVELDIEVTHAIAPAAHLLVYEGPNGQDGVTAIWNQIVSDDRAQVISSSYGAPESASYPDLLNAMNTIMEEAAAQGQAIFAASGDDGAFDGQSMPTTLGDDSLQVDFPASSPWVTAVGGTQLAPGKQGTMDEHVWSIAGPALATGAGGGGGLSSFWKRPWYQVGPGVDSPLSTGYRQLPDVSALAGLPGYLIYTVDDKGDGAWQVVGGTSAATPLWAAYATLVDQKLGSPIGFMNPTLYALGQQAPSFAQPPFNDVVDGNNLHYSATPGWDLATGWGSMNGDALVRDLQVMGGARISHPIDIALRAWVGPRPTGFQPMNEVLRGQLVYLVDEVTYNALPLDSLSGTREYTVSARGKTIIQAAIPDQVTHDQVTKSYEYAVRVKIPRKAKPGKYTFTVTYTLGGQTATASTPISVR